MKARNELSASIADAFCERIAYSASLLSHINSFFTDLLAAALLSNETGWANYEDTQYISSSLFSVSADPYA